MTTNASTSGLKRQLAGNFPHFLVIEMHLTALEQFNVKKHINIVERELRRPVLSQVKADFG